MWSVQGKTIKEVSIIVPWTFYLLRPLLPVLNQKSSQTTIFNVIDSVQDDLYTRITLNIFSIYKVHFSPRRPQSCLFNKRQPLPQVCNVSKTKSTLYVLLAIGSALKVWLSISFFKFLFIKLFILIPNVMFYVHQWFLWMTYILCLYKYIHIYIVERKTLSVVYTFFHKFE